MSDLHQLIETFTPEQHEAALQVLDAVSRPLTVREIEALLRSHGVPRSRAVIVASSIKKLSIVALMGPEDNRG